ncbi:hypothetical protein Hanom_Chr06g00510501 [Helianthus anomalus]
MSRVASTRLVFPTLSYSGRLQKLRSSVAHPAYELQMQHSLQLQLSRLTFPLSLLLLNP